jgi:DNA polymerase elongation subunit (family B)
MKKAHKAGDMDRYHYYNRLQNVQKILLNSLYGVLALQTFRFHDTDNAEAITLSGQSVIKFTEKMANHYYNGALGTTGRDYVIAIDTDSIFVHALDLIKKQNPSIDETNVDLMIEKTKEITTEVQAFINKGYDVYAKKFHNVDTHRFFIKQEVIAKSGIWVAKKRYAQWMVSKEGLNVNEMDVKGLDVVRSNYPKAFGIYMKQILSDILNEVPKDIVDNKVLDFKDEFRTLPIREVMLSTGVKEISKWTGEDPRDRIKGTPAHVKAALNFNFLLGHHKIKHTKPITDGDKIKYAYLKQNEYGMESIAITGFQDPQPIVDLLNTYIDYDRIYESALMNKLQDFYDALKWGNIPANKNLSKFFEF